MDELLVANWNNKVKPGDKIFHLGDFALHKPLSSMVVLFDRLHGDKHLILGNHDSNNKIKKLGWSSIHATFLLKHNKNQFWLSHYAHRTWPHKGRGVHHLYGHSHGHLPGYGRSMDVGVDNKDLDYSPISIGEVLDKLSSIPYRIDEP
jgi:calcineurin-like phosphoesterase family protein